jgi:hypothetical protein
MLTAGDTWLLADWLHRHERLFEALAVLDGSAAVGFAQKAVLSCSRGASAARVRRDPRQG